MRELGVKSPSETLPITAISGLGMLLFLVVTLSVIYNKYVICSDCIEITSGNEVVTRCQLLLENYHYLFYRPTRYFAYAYFLRKTYVNCQVF